MNETILYVGAPLPHLMYACWSVRYDDEVASKGAKLLPYSDRPWKRCLFYLLVGGTIGLIVAALFPFSHRPCNP